jgi:hypothetical protein
MESKGFESQNKQLTLQLGLYDMRHVWNLVNPSRSLRENVFFIPKETKMHHLVEHFWHFGRLL